MTRPSRLRVAFAAAVITASAGAVLAVLAWVCHAVTGRWSPLPAGSPADWSARDVARWFTTTDVGSVDTVNVLARIGIVTVVAVVAAIAWQLFAALRDAARHGIATTVVAPAPVATNVETFAARRIGAVRARSFAAGVIATLLTIGPSAGTIAGALPARTPAVEQPIAPVETNRAMASTLTASLVSDASVYRVESATETLTSIAERATGTRSNAEAIWHANRDRVMHDGTTFSDPAVVRAGWLLHIPAHLAGEPPAPDASVVVEAGDSYWSVVEEHLAPGTSNAEILAATIATRERTAPLLAYSDPNMVRPDDVIHIVTPPTVPDAAVAAPVDGVERVAVEDGDSYWQIARDRLGPAASEADVAAYTEQLQAHNAARLGYANPRMLHPGDIVELPLFIPVTGADPAVAVRGAADRGP
jgi:nucleoid-associated protein YgaU